MMTVGRLARRFGLSRSTLLYYDSIGLLVPSGRSRANYRLYSEEDVVRMEQIALYREAGLSLEAIADILAGESGEAVQALERRLESINEEISDLRRQQQTIVALLRERDRLSGTRILTKDRWVEILRGSGLDEEGMWRWHAEFERTAPEAHQDFLESLGIRKKEIAAIRNWSRSASNP